MVKFAGNSPVDFIFCTKVVNLSVHFGQNRDVTDFLVTESGQGKSRQLSQITMLSDFSGLGKHPQTSLGQFSPKQLMSILSAMITLPNLRKSTINLKYYFYCRVFMIKVNFLLFFKINYALFKAKTGTMT